MHGNVVITVSQTLVPCPGSLPEEGDGVYAAPAPRDALKPLDESGGWTVQAAVRVVNTNDVANNGLAQKELTALRETIKGVCDLEVVERLAFDTRVKG